MNRSHRSSTLPRLFARVMLALGLAVRLSAGLIAAAAVAGEWLTTP